MSYQHAINKLIIMKQIEKIEKWQLDGRYYPDGYDMTSMPDATPDNIDAIINKLNEVIDMVNKIVSKINKL